MFTHYILENPWPAGILLAGAGVAGPAVGRPRGGTSVESGGIWGRRGVSGGLRGDLGPRERPGVRRCRGRPASRGGGTT